MFLTTFVGNNEQIAVKWYISVFVQKQEILGAECLFLQIIQFSLENHTECSKLLTQYYSFNNLGLEIEKSQIVFKKVCKVFNVPCMSSEWILKFVEY